MLYHPQLVHLNHRKSVMFDYTKSVLAVALALMPFHQALAVDEITAENIDQLSGIVSVNHFTSEAATNRTLTITGNGLTPSQTISYVAAGLSYYRNSVPDSTHNTLIVNGTLSGTKLYGGYSAQGNATGNKVEVTNINVGDSKMGSIYGGYACETGTASENSVTVKKGSTVLTDSGTVTGGSAYKGAALNNTVTVESNATVTAHVKGATAGNGYANQTSNAEGNTVIVKSSATVNGNVTGAETNFTASKTTVNIYGTVNGNVYGATTNVSRGATPISDTVVNLIGARVEGELMVISQNLTNLLGSGNALSMTDSTVTGLVKFSNYENGSMTFTGVNTVGRLEKVGELILNVTDVNQVKAVLTWTQGKSQIGSPIEGNLDLREATVVISGANTIDPQGSYKLIDNNGSGIIYVSSKTKIEMRGVFVNNLWEAEIPEGVSYVPLIDGIQVTNGDMTSGDLVIAIGKEKLNDNSKTLAESFLGSIAFVNQGSEFIADEGLRAINTVATTKGFTAFGAIHGGTSRYETGSHVDVDGVSLATGAASRFGNLTVAGFIEAGWATSESHVSGATGDGDHDYYGLGAAMRYSFESPWYVEGSARLGWASTEFDGKYSDAAATYDADSFYGSLHVAAGYVWDINDKMALDLYGRYTFTYLEGDTVDMKGVDATKFEMDDVMTHAFRVGARLTGEFNDAATWRVGLAYEHVSDGDAESSVIEKTRLALETPTLEGDTGIVEVGVHMTPSQTSPWSFDIGAKGYVGDRKGVSGSATVTFTF